jgi:plastocyanin
MHAQFQRILCLAALQSLLAGLVIGCAGGNSVASDPANEPSTGAASSQKAAHAGTEENAPNQVIIDNFAFRPREMTIPAGTKVTWVNHDDVPHTATSTAKPRSFDSGTLDTDGHFSHVFATPGTFNYFCAVHPHMTGKIIVK